MLVRETARVLLFDPGDRLLLMKIDDPNVKDPAKPWLKAPFWVTIGGGVEPGEDVLVAARREIEEETGLRDLTIGPVVWSGQQILLWKGQPTRLTETFVVARTRDARITDASWSDDERRAIVEMRWWPIDEIESTTETILPTVLPKLIGAVARGEVSAAPVCIDLTAPPST